MTRPGITALAIIMALIIAGGTIGISAQPLETYLVVHFDFDEWERGYPATGIHDLWNDPAVVNWRSTVLEGLLNEAQEEMGIDPRSILPHLTGQMAFALYAAPNATAHSNQPFKVAFAARQPGQVDAFLNLIEQALPDDEARAEMRAGTFQTPIAFSIGEDPAMAQWLVQAVESGPQALGLSPAPGEFVSSRFAMGQFVRSMQRLGAADRDVMQVLAELGIHNLETVTLNGRFNGRGIIDEVVLDFNGPMSGMISLIGPPREFSNLDLVPPEAMGATSLSIVPPDQIWNWILGMAGRIEPHSLQQLLQIEREVEIATGMNMRGQILPAFGEEITIIAGGMTGFTPDFALIIDVNDPTVASASIQALFNLVQREFMPNRRGNSQMQTIPMNIGEHQFSLVSIPGAPVQIAHGIIDGRLVITTSYNQMNWICQAVDSGQSILSLPAFTQAAADMPQSVSMISYSDNEAQIQMLGQSIAPMMMAGGNMPPEVTQTMALLPVIAQYLGQDVSVLTTDPSRMTIQMNHTTGASVIAAAPVLAAVAVPNFLEAQSRAEVARTRADMRSMATALESYFIDNNAYPVWVNGSDPTSVSTGNSLLTEMPTFRSYVPGSAMTLTTPLAYITSHMTDVFNPDQETPATFSYFSDRRGWIITSPGPDSVFDFNPEDIYHSEMQWNDLLLIQNSYDPTNGTVSSGDIWRIRQ